MRTVKSSEMLFKPELAVALSAHMEKQSHLRKHTAKRFEEGDVLMDMSCLYLLHLYILGYI